MRASLSHWLASISTRTGRVRLKLCKLVVIDDGRGLKESNALNPSLDPCLESVPEVLHQPGKGDCRM